MDLSRFLDLFVAESREHLAAADELVHGLGAVEGDAGAIKELFRHVHSLKGMAASMGFPALAALAHAAEDLMDEMRSGSLPPSPPLAALLLDSLSCMEAMVDAAEKGRPVEDPRAVDLASSLREPLAPRPETRIVTALPSPAPVRLGDPAALVEEETAPVPDEHASDDVSLPAWRVDLKLAASSLPAVQAASTLGRLAKLGKILRSDPPMAALRAGKFDGKLSALLLSSLSPKALATEVARFEEVESFQLVPAAVPKVTPAAATTPASWIRVRADLLDALVGQMAELMLEQGRLASAAASSRIDEVRPRADRCHLQVRKLYGDLLELRLVPFETVAHRLRRGVRDLSRSLGKQVRFDIAGQEVRIDRSHLDSLVDPLLHLVRNAFDHGIETPAERVAAGKPAEGSVRLRITRERDQVRIAVEDDGRGLRPEILRRAAVERGLLSAAEVDRLTDGEALLLTTLPGFSTAQKGGQISGRGVGLDVVRSSVESLGGHLEIDSSPGRGSRILLTLPLAAAIVQALMVRSSGHLYAVPISSVDRTARLEEGSVVARDGKATLATPQGTVELFDLDRRLGIASSAPPAQRSALLYPAGGRTVGLVVDEVLGRREILVKPLLPPLDVLRNYEGVALLQDGSVALVLDPVSLVTRT